MKLIQLVQMVEISKTGSMNKAAQNLFISQPNLSASMKDLENELNASIFTRSHKGVELTNIGKEVLKYAKSILKDVENIKTLTTNESEKNLLTLNISAPTLLFVQDVFSKLCLKYASHPAKFNLRTGNNPDIINDLVLKKSNLGIVVFSSDREDFYMDLFKKKNLEYTELFAEPAYVHLGPNNPLYHENKFKLKDYKNFPFVVCSYNYTDNFSAFFERSGFEPSSVIKVSTMENVLNIVSTTNIIHLGLKLHSNLTFSSVRSIPLNLDGYHFKVGLIENASSNLCEITSEFIEMIKNLER